MRAEPAPFFRVLMLVFGGSLTVQVLAFLRQIVIAAAFGLERAMDLYVMVFAVATIAAFGLGATIEAVAVPRLVERIEAGDREGFRTIATRVLVMSLGVGGLCCLAFGIGLPVFAYVVTRGLTDADRSGMFAIAPWFLPWVFLAAPFYALGAVLKAERRFSRYFAAEIAVTLVSTAVLLGWRPHVGAIALAYGIGYAIGLLVMLQGVRLNFHGGAWRADGSQGLRRQLGRLFLTNQVGSLNVVIDRFLQSFLPAGAIAGASYAALITGNVGAVLGFRDAFMAPLSQAEGKADKLERILIGLAMLAIPIAAFLSFQAEAVVGVLLERGRFDRAATELAGSILALQAPAILASALLLPMFRLLQILDHMRLSGLLLLAGGAFLMLFGIVLMFGLGFGLKGYAVALTLTAYASLGVAAILLVRAGIAPDWLRILRYAIYALAASALGCLAGAAMSDAGGRLANLILRGIAFAAVMAVAYCAIHRRLRAIAYAFNAPQGAR
jgi:putative peptidoglycan lipid II flippase